MSDMRDLYRRTVGFLKARDGGIHRRTLRSSIWVSISSAMSTVISLGRSVVLARLLGPEVFGLISIAMVAIRGAEIFTQTGFAAALIQRKQATDYAQAQNTVFTLNAVRGVLLSLLVYAVAPVVASFYGREELTNIIRALAVSFIFGGLTNVGLLGDQRRLQFQRVVYHEQLTTILSFVVVTILAWVWRDVWALVWGHVITSFMALVFSYVVISERPRFGFDRQLAAELFRYGKYVGGLAIVVYVTTEIDNVFIGKIMGPETLGLYVIAYTLANLPATHFSKVISRVMFPAYSRLQDDIQMLRNAYLMVFRVVATMVIPASAGMAVLAPEIVEVVYGEKWVAAGDALRVLAIFGCLRAISSLNGYVLQAVGRPEIVFHLNLAKLVVIAVLIYPLTIRYGTVGAAIAVTVPQMIEFAYGMWKFARIVELPLRKILGPLGRILLPSAIMAAIVERTHHVFHHVGILALAGLVLMGVAIYCAFKWRDLRMQYEWIRGGGAARVKQ